MKVQLKALPLIVAMLAGAAQAELQNLGDGTVLDTSTNLVWLHDWDDPGVMSWSDGKSWAANLKFGGGNAGDWRLPEIDEYRALWTEVGGTLEGLQANFNDVYFTAYRANTEYAPDLSQALLFRSWSGQASRDLKSLPRYVVAVRANVAAVPEPQTYAMLLAGLGLLGVAVRQRSPR